MGNSKVKKLNKKKMSGGSIAAIVVAIVILVAFVLSLLASNGVFFRMKKGASSDNFDVNGSMMSYYTNSYYQNWLNQYYYYIYLGYIDFDPSASLKDQYVDDKKTQTYYDMFADAAKEQVTQILTYCEAALADKDVDFAKLEADAKTDADEAIEYLAESAKKSGYSTASYIRMTFGENVKENDVYDAMVLQNVASAYSKIVYDRFYDAVTDSEKDDYFGKNLADFVTAKYLTYSISASVAVPTVDESKYEGGKESQEYKDALAAAKAKAKEANEAQKLKDREFIDKLANAASVEEFKTILLEHRFDTNAFNAAYETAVKNFADADKPSDGELSAFKLEIKTDVINATLEGKDDIYEDEASDEKADESKAKTWEDVKKELPAAIITSLKSTLTSAEKNPSYALEKDVDKWLFGGVKAQFGIEYAENEDKEGTSAKAGETKTLDEISDEETGKYTLTVYYVTEEAGRDETVLRNVGHILFGVDSYGSYKTLDDAKAKADKIYEELLKKADGNGLVSKEDFEAIGLENTDDSSVFYENVGKGQMVEAFEAWLFDQTEVGKMGFVETEYGWHIMYYCGESDSVAWSYSAHESVAGEKLDNWYEGLSYEINVDESIFKSILK